MSNYPRKEPTTETVCFLVEGKPEWKQLFYGGPFQIKSTSTGKTVLKVKKEALNFTLQEIIDREKEKYEEYLASKQKPEPVKAAPPKKTARW